MTTILIIGFLLLGAPALVALLLAASQAEDGCEDASGFHRLTKTPVGGRLTWEADPEGGMNYIEGIYCSTKEIVAARDWNREQFQRAQCERASREPFPASFI